MLGGKESIYPKHLEQQFLRVLNRIIELWDSPEIDDYFMDLLIDNRGNRQGFPPDVVSELFALSQFHAKLRSQEQATDASNPWGDVEDLKRAAFKKESYDVTPRRFLQSVEKGSLHEVALCLNSGMDIETRDVRGWTPLMMSSFNGNEEVALLLVQNGADIHAKDTGGYGSLHWAAFNGHDNLVKLLIEKNADTNALSNHGWTPLLQASSRGHLIAARHLIDGGANVNLATNEGWTPLHKAAANGHTEMVKLLLTRGANRDAEYQDGTTPLALAAKNKHDDIVALLT